MLLGRTFVFRDIIGLCKKTKKPKKPNKPKKKLKNLKTQKNFF